MRRSKTASLATVALAGFLGVSIGAHALDADPAEATRMRQTIERFLGAPEPGAPSVIEVTPVGDHYDVGIDLDRLAAPIRNFGVDLKLGRLAFRLTPKGDGTLGYAADRIEPMSWGFAGQTGRIAFEDLHAEGIFDPALAGFSSQTLHVGRIVTEQTAPAKDDVPRIDIRKVDEAVDMTMSARAAASGSGIDATVVQTSRNAVETLTLTEGTAKGIPDIEATLKVAATRTDIAIAGFRALPFYDLWAHLVAHHAPEDFTTRQADLKARIAALGPVFETMHQTVKLDAVEIETPVGFGSLAGVQVDLDLAGVTRDGFGDLRIALTGLEMHSLFIPKWAQTLIPVDLTLHGRGAGWDAAAALAAFLDSADFAASKPLTPDAEIRILGLLLPKGSLSIDLAGNHARAGIWDLTLDGHLDTGPNGARGTVTVRATGLDKVAATLADPKVPAELKAAIGEIDKATSLAERQPDGSLLWRFDIDGSAVSVNGRSLAEPTPPAPAAPVTPEPAPKSKSKAKPEKSGEKKV